MFIVWGTRQVEKKLGWVADYCPICDEPRVFKLIELRLVSHLYYISMGRGEVQGHARQCKRCRNKIGTDASKYQSVSRDKRASLEQLTDETYPGLIEGMAGYLDLRERAELGEADPQDRRGLLRQPFHSIIFPVAQRKANMHFDGRSGLWLLAMVVLPLPLMLLMDALPRPFSTDPWIIGAILGLFVILGVGLIVSIAYDAQRFARRRFGKMIVKHLAPLDPSVEELEEIITELRADRDTKAIGKSFRAEKLHAKILKHREKDTLPGS